MNDYNLLREKYKKKQDQDTINKMEENEKRVYIWKDIESHQAIKWLKEDLSNVIITINTKLLNNEPLEMIDREKLLTDRERCEFILDKFNNLEMKIDNINKLFNKKLNKK
jgi:hypothetical protein